MQTEPSVIPAWFWPESRNAVDWIPALLGTTKGMFRRNLFGENFGESPGISVETSVETQEASVETYETSVETLEASVEPSVERPETSVKTSDVLLKLLQQNPEMTLAEVADHIGRTVRAVERASAKLVKAGNCGMTGRRKADIGR